MLFSLFFFFFPGETEAESRKHHLLSASGAVAL